MANTFTFDGPTKIIQLDSTGSFQVADMYSRWKDWVLLNPQFQQAFRFVGGDPTVGSDSLGITYFIMNGWRIRPAAENHRLQVDGNIFENDGNSPFTSSLGSNNVLIETKVSNLTDATVLDSAIDERLDYQNIIWYDPENGYSGSLHPIGTSAQPSNNLADLLSIKSTYGINKINVMSDSILDQNVAGLRFEGQTNDIDLVLATAGSFSNCFFDNVKLTGDSNGDPIHAVNSVIYDLTFKGLLGSCGLSGSIYLSSGSNSTMHDCFSMVPGNGAPVMDFISSSDAGLNMRGYSGGVNFQNVIDANNIMTVEMIAGRLNVDNTNTAGLIVARGVGYLNVDSGGTTVNTDGFLDPSKSAGLDPNLGIRVKDIWQRQGLDSDNPLTASTSSLSAGDVTQSIDVQSEQTIVTRQ